MVLRALRLDRIEVHTCVSPTMTRCVRRSTTMDQITTPRAGDIAPKLDADTATGGHFDLDDHAGEWVAVYFFPRANTPG
jgi:hypothetical protein